MSEYDTNLCRMGGSRRDAMTRTESLQRTKDSVETYVRVKNCEKGRYYQDSRPAKDEGRVGWYVKEVSGSNVFGFQGVWTWYRRHSQSETR